MSSTDDAQSEPEAISIDADRLRTELVSLDGPYQALDVVPSTGSTNADLREAAFAGAHDRTVLIAEEQTSGVGRLARSWVSPKGSGMYLSVLLRPSEVPSEALGSLALAAGVALLDTARALGVDAVLKWPNDLLAGDPPAKLAGILAEVVPDNGELVVVLGIGLNVHPLSEVPPGPGGLPATSLAEHGARDTDRGEVAEEFLLALAEREAAWRAAGGDLEAAGLLEDYRASCSTLGSQVRVELPDGGELLGEAIDVDAAGQLVIRTEDGSEQAVLAGDVVHVRVN